MKKYTQIVFALIISILCLPFLQVNAQPQTAFKYQVVLRDTLGNVYAHTNAAFIMFIIDGTDDPNELGEGPVVYSEIHEAQSNEYGLITLQIGSKQPNQFEDLDWGNRKYWLAVNVKLEEWTDYTLMGKSPILPGPFEGTSGGTSASHWEKEGVNIYYTQGTVGIGTIPPNNTTSRLLLHAVNTFGSPFANGNILSLSSEGAEGPLVFGKLNESGDSYIQSAKNGGASKLFINPEGGGSQITGSSFGLPFTSGNILELTSLDAQGAIVLGKINGGGDSFIQSAKNGGTSKLFINPEGGGSQITGSSFGLPFTSGNILEINAKNTQGSMVFGKLNEAGDSFIQSVKNEGGSSIILNPEGGFVGIGLNTPPTEALEVNGRTKTKVLEITGGSDIGENMNSIEALQPGDVVVIDENNPGNVIRTTQKHNKKVAGVISGANGVNPGISLSQTDVLEGEYPLAMLGRVYVKVMGKVEIGDMLTTSNVPGHAMAVKDFSNAHGTVIGKAMSGNEKDNGMVLLLVQPQ